VDDAFGQEVQDLVAPALRRVRGVQVIEAAIFADDDDDVLDRCHGRAVAPFAAVLLRTGRVRSRHSAPAAQRCDQGDRHDPLPSMRGTHFGASRARRMARRRGALGPGAWRRGNVAEKTPLREVRLSEESLGRRSREYFRGSFHPGGSEAFPRRQPVKEVSLSRYLGKCFCGAVEIAVTGEPVGMGYCHCSSCRSWSASPVNGFTLWPREAVTVTKGEKNV